MHNEVSLSRADRQWAFLAEVSAALASSLDYKTVLQQVAQLALPILADWCLVSTVEPNGAIEWLAVAHGDPSRAEIARELQRRYPRHRDDPSGVATVLRTGKALVFTDDSDDSRADRAHDAEHLDMLRILDSRSSMIVPLNTHGQTLGAISLIMAESGRHHDASDLALAQQLAARCAQAVENARLYRAAQEEIAARERVERALRASEERLLALHDAARLVAGQIPDSHAALDEVLRSAAHLLGASSATLHRWEPESGLVRCIRGWQLPTGHVPREAGPGGPTLAAQALARGEPMVVNDYPAWEFAAPSAVQAGVRAALAVPLVRGGEPFGVLVVSSNVEHPRVFTSDDVRLATLFGDLAATSLTVATSIKDEMVSMITHEVRTPATTLVSYAELLYADAVPEHERREVLRSMVEEGRRLTALITDFLDLQRLESGRLSIKARPTDLATTLLQAVSRIAADRSRRITVDLPDRLPLVLADASRIQQVLDNLLVNACKYSPDGGEVRVEAREAERDHMVEVAVVDQGLGIPAEALPSLFEKFYRVPGEERCGIHGTGLGLAIARQIIEDHGGTIGATSDGPGFGSRFFFRLPIAPPPAITRMVASEPPAAGPSGLRVLMVDDDPATRGAVVRILRPFGHRVTPAASAQEALDHLAGGAFDVVISDLHMGPGMDGRTLAAQVRRSWPGTRFILATGSVNGESDTSAEVDAVIGKPYRPVELQQALADVTAARR